VRDENSLDPGRLDSGAALRIFRTFLLISLGTPIVFFIYEGSSSGILFSFTGFLYLSIWASGFSLDVWTTYSFYAADRENFSVNESNAVFSGLVRRFGFTKGLAVQLAIIEMSTAWGLLCYCILYITRLLNTIQIVLRLF